MHLSVLLGLVSAGHLQDAEVVQGCNLEKSGESHVFATVSLWAANKCRAATSGARACQSCHENTREMMFSQ